ncbi:MAG: hypothetical protein WD512_04390 [Candidatus Paceibacterota bacterium]
MKIIIKIFSGLFALVGVFFVLSVLLPTFGMTPEAEFKGKTVLTVAALIFFILSALLIKLAKRLD